MATSTLDIADCINETCPWSGEPVQADSLTEYDGKVVGFCNPGCRDKFEAAIRHFDGAEFITATTEENFRQARTLLREYEDFVEVDLCFQGFEEELGNLEHARSHRLVPLDGLPRDQQLRGESRRRSVVHGVGANRG